MEKLSDISTSNVRDVHDEDDDKRFNSLAEEVWDEIFFHVKEKGYTVNEGKH